MRRTSHQGEGLSFHEDRVKTLPKSDSLCSEEQEQGVFDRQGSPSPLWCCKSGQEGSPWIGGQGSPPLPSHFLWTLWVPRQSC